MIKPRRLVGYGAQSVAFSLAAAMAVAIPCWQQGALTPGLLLLPTAAAGALAARFCAGGDILSCLAALTFGLTLDFMRMPPALMQALCVAGNDALPALLVVHVRWFAVTTFVMAVLLVVRRPSIAALPLVMLELGAMLTVMVMVMGAMKLLVEASGRQFGAEAMASAMVLGMLIFHLCDTAASVCLSQRSQRHARKKVALLKEQPDKIGNDNLVPPAPQCMSSSYFKSPRPPTIRG